MKNNIHDKPFYRKEVIVDGKPFNRSYPIELHIETLTGCGLPRGQYKPDCRIGHFGYNIWLRTPYGMKYKAYKSEKTLESAVERVLKNKGFTVLGWKVNNSNWEEVIMRYKVIVRYVDSITSELFNDLRSALKYGNRMFIKRDVQSINIIDRVQG